MRDSMSCLNCKRLLERLDKLLLKKPTGARGQVVTLMDCVETKEGYFYGLRAQELEERELDHLAQIYKLKKQVEALINRIMELEGQ